MRGGGGKGRKRGGYKDLLKRIFRVSFDFCLIIGRIQSGRGRKMGRDFGKDFFGRICLSGSAGKDRKGIQPEKDISFQDSRNRCR